VRKKFKGRRSDHFDVRRWKKDDRKKLEFRETLRRLLLMQNKTSEKEVEWGKKNWEDHPSGKEILAKAAVRQAPLRRKWRGK